MTNYYTWLKAEDMNNIRINPNSIQNVPHFLAFIWVWWTILQSSKIYFLQCYFYNVVTF